MREERHAFISQGISFSGSKEFRCVLKDYNFFIYGEDVYFIGDFDTYISLDIDHCVVPPICTADDFYIFEEDIREYYNNVDLYGKGPDISLVSHNHSAELITNIKGFDV